MLRRCLLGTHCYQFAQCIHRPVLQSLARFPFPEKHFLLSEVWYAASCLWHDAVTTNNRFFLEDYFGLALARATDALEYGSRVQRGHVDA